MADLPDDPTDGAAAGPRGEEVPDLAQVARDLLAWYGDHRRELPWRDADDPYATLVSEVMLQQTQVATVEPYYEAFLERFPTVQALASADEDAVLEAWAGLGYYRRARHLHAAAKRIVADHGGQVPDDPQALRDLPGVGDYTAGAVASIAFRRPEPAIDANAARVLARLLREEGRVDRAGPKRRLEAAARLLLQAGPPADLNQALMELGALVCRPDRPRCEACPVAAHCLARAGGVQADLPVTKAAPSGADRPVVDVAALVVEAPDGAVLLVKAPPDGLLGGTWGFPWTEVADGEPPAHAARRLAGELGLADPSVRGLLGEARHVFSHREWALRVVAVDVADAAPAVEAPAHRWVPRGTLDPDALPTAHRRVAERMGDSVQAQL